MPMIDFFLEEDALPDNSIQDLCKRVGQVALEHERFDGSALAKSLTWIYAHKMPRRYVLQAQGRPTKPLYRFAIYTLEGLLDKERKHSLASKIARLVYEAEGSVWNSEEATNRVWVLYEDKKEGDWIDGEQLNSLAELRQIIEHDKRKHSVVS